MKIQFVGSKELILTTHAGLATVGALIAHTQLTKRLNHSVIKDVESPYNSHADVIKAILVSSAKARVILIILSRSVKTMYFLFVCNWKKYRQAQRSGIGWTRRLHLHHGFRNIDTS